MRMRSTTDPAFARADAAVVRSLVVLLAVSYALRLALVAGGGQWFWADESRFVQAVDAVRLIAAGDLSGGLRSVAGTADHVGFKLLALLPAAVQVLAGAPLALSAALLALVSTLNVALVYLVARRAGADGVEALGAALAMACSNTMFFWARHLMPYDTALAFGLLLVFVALNPAARPRDALVAGALAFAAFATYNGYWTLAALGCALHVLRALPDVRACVVRGLVIVVGFAACAAMLAGVAWVTLDVDLVSSWRGFAGTVTQGDFHDGHGVVAGSLWHAERALVVVWACAALAMPFAAVAGRVVAPRAWLWLACGCALLAALVVGSNLLERFVSYGRLARQAVPFFSLMTGYVLFGPWRHAARLRFAVPLSAALLAGIAATNFAQPLRLTFPAEFVAQGRVLIASRGGDSARFAFVNAKFPWPQPEPVLLAADARVVLAAPHPLTFQPYLYEGFDRRQRAAYRAADLTMRLVEWPNAR